MNAANVFYYAQLATWAGFMLAYTDFEDGAKYAKVRIYDAVNKLVPAILLIISIVLFRCKLKNQRSNKVFAIEKLMIISLAIFIFYVIIYAASLALRFFMLTYGGPTDYTPMKFCRFYIAT